jgi:NADH dehydrogenase
MRAPPRSPDGVQIAECGEGSEREYLRAQTIICTIGTAANPLAAKLGLPLSKGRIVVEPHMGVAGHPGVWALGDCACVPNAFDGRLSPPTAQFAVRQARHLAGNLLAALHGRPTRAFSYRSRGMMASIGHLKGVAEVGGVEAASYPGDKAVVNIRP